MPCPLSAGTFHVSFTCPDPTPAAGAVVGVRPPGASGIHVGLAAVLLLHGPTPTAFLAATRYPCHVLRVSPLTVSVVAVDTPSSIGVYAVGMTPSPVSTTKSVIGAPLLAGVSHVSLTWPRSRPSLGPTSSCNRGAAGRHTGVAEIAGLDVPMPNA